MPNILLLDVETAPSVAYVWGLHDENIPLDRLIKPGHILCWAAKWYKKPDMQFGSKWTDGDRMIPRLRNMFLEADAVVTYNGNRFDLPKIRGEVLALGLDPIPPVTSIDLYTTSRKLGYPSGKLAYVAKHLGLGAKAQHNGFDTWIGVMEGIERDQKVMERYNKMDVRLLERLYTVLRPHIKEHPYMGAGVQAECPVCKSKKIQKRGNRRTKAFLIEKLQCQGCGAWFSGKKLSVPKHK